jgi:hypothetical protein
MLRALWTTFQEGIGYKRFAISGVVGAVIVVFYFVARRFAITSLLEIPHWAVGCVAALALLLFWMLQYADGLRRQLQPKIELSSDPKRGCVLETPIQEGEFRDGRVVITGSTKRSVCGSGLKPLPK